MRLLSLCLVAVCVAPAQEPSPSAEEIERQHLRQLLNLRRIYVDRLSTGVNAGQIRDMVITALQRTRLFVITEDESRADGYLRGSAEDLIFTDTRSSREGLHVRASGRASQREGSEGELVAGGVSLGETEDQFVRERKHEAIASLRLVDRGGDVLWSTTQESLGAKYKGSSADVAERIAKELQAAYVKAKKLVGHGSSLVQKE